MNLDSFDILVIILSITLAIFLVMAIILVSYLIKIAKEMSRITDKAGSVVSNIEAVSKAATSKGPASFLSSIIATVVEKSTKGEEKDN